MRLKVFWSTFQCSILSVFLSSVESSSLTPLNPSSAISCFAIKFLAIRHWRYFLERCLHCSDLWAEDLRQPRYSFFSASHSCKWSKGKMPFSGGIGLNPLFPPNAPPVLISSLGSWKSWEICLLIGFSIGVL